MPVDRFQGKVIPVVPASSGNGAASDRSCDKCHHSLELQPTNKEVKAGLTSGGVYCCHSAVVVKMNDGVYPRLTVRARESGSLCGPQGKLFEPYKGELVAALTQEDIRRAQRLIRRATEENRDRAPTRQSDFGQKRPEKREREHRERFQNFKSNPARKPYKVT